MRGDLPNIHLTISFALALSRGRELVLATLEDSKALRVTDERHLRCPRTLLASFGYNKGEGRSQYPKYRKASSSLSK